MMGELKPCPLCGGDDVVLSQVTSSGGWGVLCRGCHVYQDTRAEYSDDAVSAWNRRPDAPSAGEWMPIETAPEKPCGVILYVPDEGHEGLISGQDYSLQIGFWSGDGYREQGTGHDYRERSSAWGGDDAGLPTHWRPLPAPPQADGGEG